MGGLVGIGHQHTQVSTHSCMTTPLQPSALTLGLNTSLQPCEGSCG